MALKQIYVTPTEKAGRRAILTEKHPDHPDGEVFLHGHGPDDDSKPVKVAATQRILDAIHAGYLVETTAAGKEK